MKWTLLLTTLLIGLVSGDGAWKQDREYKYKLKAGTFSVGQKSKNRADGILTRVNLSIRPQSDNILIGQFSQFEYATINDRPLNEVTDYTLSEERFTYDAYNARYNKQFLLAEPFKIHLENGVIRALSVDQSMTDVESNELKNMLSVFQVDTKAQNLISHRDNQLPEENSNNGLYKTMEPTVTGNCETTYEITTLPEYLVKTYRNRAITEERDFIKITKSRNNRNCRERFYSFTDVVEDSSSSSSQNSNEIDNVPLSEVSKVIVSGTLQSYTIQSTVSTKKVIFNHDLARYSYVDATLESVERDTSYTGIRSVNTIMTGILKNIGNLVGNSAKEGVKGDDDMWTGSYPLWYPNSKACRETFGENYRSDVFKWCTMLINQKFHCVPINTVSAADTYLPPQGGPSDPRNTQRDTNVV